MAIDFPASPTTGQTFTSGSLVYTYDGTKWTAEPAGVTGGTKIEVSNTKAEIIDTGSDGRFVVTTEGSERLRVDSSGQVGIGTTSPTSTLTASLSSGAGNTFPLHLQNPTNFGWGVGMKFRQPLATGGAVIDSGAIVSDWDSTNGGNLEFYTTSGASLTEKARIDSSGRLLVGTSSTSADTRAVITGSSGYPNGSGDLRLNLGGTPASTTGLGLLLFTANNGSDVGAYITGTRDGGTWTSGSSHPGRLVFSTTADGASSPTERMRITSTGRFNFNTGSASPSDTVNGAQIHETGYIFCSVDGNPAGFFNRNTSDGTLVGFRRSNVAVGSISVTTTATAYNTSSDYRLKENVVPLTGAVDRVNQLQVHRFNFIADPDKTVDGFIAHEAQAVVPECVTGAKDEVDDDGNPVYQGIDQSKLVPLLTAALQEALAEIESLKARVTALEP